MVPELQPYPAYKDSGVPWHGEVPEHWRLQPTRAVFAERVVRGHIEEPLLSVAIRQGVLPQSSLLTDTSKKDSSNQDKSNYKLVEPGDIAYNKMRAWQGAAGMSKYRGIVSPAYGVIRPRGDNYSAYYHYVFRMPAFTTEAEKWSYGITSDQWSLRYKDFKSITLPVPPPEEQHAITRFLDHIDRRINRYIRAKRRLIAMLKEQKQAIIHRAVTRGLDPNVPLKPSGVEWLGEIPAHWDVVALKRVLRQLFDCEHKTAPAVDASPYHVIRTSAVRNGQLRLEGTYFTSQEAFTEWTKRGLPEAGDVIFTREAPAGEACVIPDGLQVCLGQRTVLMKPDKEKYSSAFLVHMIYGGPPRDIINVTSQGSTVDHFNMADIAALSVFVPPLEEQRQIVDWLDGATSALDAAIQRAAAEISLIREYRTRLISDVVTGKLDVRGVALPEEIEEDVEELIDDEEMDGEGEEMDAWEEVEDGD
jgi:type I restriction enzyme, S subunit